MVSTLMTRIQENLETYVQVLTNKQLTLQERNCAEQLVGMTVDIATKCNYDVSTYKRWYEQYLEDQDRIMTFPQIFDNDKRGIPESHYKRFEEQTRLRGL